MHSTDTNCSGRSIVIAIEDLHLEALMVVQLSPSTVNRKVKITAASASVSAAAASAESAVAGEVGAFVGRIVGVSVGIAMHSVLANPPAVHVPAAQSWHSSRSWNVPDVHCSQLPAPTYNVIVPAAHS